MSFISALPTDPISGLRHLLLRHQPPTHARMTPPQYTAKYLRNELPITDADLAAHLAGDSTLACMLQRDEQSCVAAVDIDTGGEWMIRRVMRAAELRACHAYGFVLTSGSHDGGHVWLFFDHAHPSHDLQVLMRDIVADAQCPTTEIYPSGADLRLPFGLHRRCNQRGTLLLTSAAAPLDLDTDLPGALATFLASVRLTSDLPVRVAQEAQQARRAAVAESIAASRPRRIDPDAHWREVIAQFNESTNLVALLEGYGARTKYHYASGKVLMYCAASQDHAHGDKHPSLVVEPGRGHQAGRMICGCYSPTCRLHNQPSQVMDAFEVYCRLENITKREAVQRLQRRDARPMIAPARPTLVDAPGVSSRSAVIPTTDSRPLAPVSQSLLMQRRLVDINTDRRVQPLDRRLLAYVIAHNAQGQGLANATIAAALGAQPDSIKRAKRRLRELGYIEVAMSADGVSPSAITIIGTQNIAALPEKSAEVAETGVQDAPPSHVSESTCDGATPPPESEPNLQERPVGEGVQMPSGVSTTDTAPAVRPELALRRRHSVLLNMIRAGVSERRRLAFTAELAGIEAQLSQQAATVEQLPCSEDSANYDEAPANPSTRSGQVCYLPTFRHVQSGSTTSSIQIAHPNDPHPTITDAQLTAVLRDVLYDRLPSTGRALLERVSWRLEGDQVQLVCAARDLAPVTGQLLAASRRALVDLELPNVVRVQIGRPVSVGVRPTWIDDALWTRVPVWARGILVGSVVVEGRLYGATRERTAGLVGMGEVVAWVCAVVVAV